MKKLLQLLGFYGNDYDEDPEDYSGYEEELPRNTKKPARGRADEPYRGKANTPKLVFFRGIPSEGIKLRLRDALLEGAMVLLDLQGLEAERIEEGQKFINFMGGVAFAHKGLFERIGPSLFVLTPHEGMLQWWAEEEEE